MDNKWSLGQKHRDQNKTERYYKSFGFLMSKKQNVRLYTEFGGAPCRNGCSCSVQKNTRIPSLFVTLKLRHQRKREDRSAMSFNHRIIGD